MKRLQPKKKMQKVSFENLEEFLAFLPEEELKLVEFLRKFIFDSVPNISEKLSFNVPYYKKNKGLFFIWPASILWGTKQTYTGVRFGFQQGYLMADEINYLDKGDRKQVYWKDFKNIKEIDVELLRAYIYEAVLVDEELNRKKKLPNGL